jgi:hypothetical protein
MGREGRKPRKPESSREQAALPHTNLVGSKKWARLFGWAEPVGAPARGLEGFCGKAQERKLGFERTQGSLERRKALKSEAQECWRLRDTSQDSGDENRREGSQTLSAELPRNLAMFCGRFLKEKRKKGSPFPQTL